VAVQAAPAEVGIPLANRNWKVVRHYGEAAAASASAAAPARAISSGWASGLSPFPGVENVALAPSQGQERPRRAARRRRGTTMTLQRMDNVLIVVNDLEAAKAFFVELGMELEGETTVEGSSVDRLIGLQNVRATLALMRTPDGHGRIELDKFHTPEAIRTGPENVPVNALGIRRIMFAVDDFDDVVARLRAHGAELVGEVVQYEDTYRLCYVRGPEGIIVGLAEQLR
jgi:catechol 2,3-dioxygenase-like lactoylglutathione lyase family enzyme